jgi:hypothetical protein
VMDIPMDPKSTPQYLIVFDDGTRRAVSASDMPSLIPTPTSVSPNSVHLLPPFLQLGSKITFDHDGQYHKGFLGQSPDGTFRFSFKSHINKKSEDWGVLLPNLASTWQDLCLEGILLPGHQPSSFRRATPPSLDSASHVPTLPPYSTSPDTPRSRHLGS